MMRIGIRRRAAALVIVLAGVLLAPPARAADPAFAQFLAAVWPEAQRAGVTRATFDALTRDLEPDLTLPDLVIPGQPPRPERGQAEFVSTPAEYLKEATIERLAAKGRQLLAEHRATLSAIEKRFGVPPEILLAIWARETAYGGAKLPYDALRTLATQAYVGRRKDRFRPEFILAMKMLQDRVATRAVMRSSWAGAMGLVQFMPSDFDKYAVDMDGDGRRNIFSSIPDALSSAAAQLVGKGWQAGETWAYEVRAPKNLDCTSADPDVTMTVAEWARRGFTPAYGRSFSRKELAAKASLFLPAGIYGPAFLILPNYYVIKSYNFSDLYVMFVGHLADRIAAPRPFEAPWQPVVQMKSSDLETIQRALTRRKLYSDKIDGKAGMATRLAIGHYQKANGLRLDCWPNKAVLDHLTRDAGR
ncbi:MAG: lytic murein transglycosylase [Variibacter sp.]